MKKTFVLCLVWFFISLSKGQSLKFEHVPVSKGLSSKSIPAIIQDKKGYLWFATQDGLNKFDGYSFKVFQNDPANKNSLSHNNIFCLFLDSDGIIWIGTEGGGLNRFDPETEKFTQYLHNPADEGSIGSNQIYCISQGPTGELWMGSWDKGITIMNRETGKFRYIRHEPNNKGSLSKAGIWQIYFDSKNHAWISLWGEGADRLNLSDNSITHFKCIPNDPTTISDSHCGLFHEDKDGIIWVTTWGGGFNRFDPKTEKFKRYTYNPTNASGIGGPRAWPIVEDENGYLWIGVYGSGLNRFDKQTETFTKYSHDKKNPFSIAHNDIWSLFIDRSGVLWIGSEGGGIDYCSMRQKEFGFISPNTPDQTIPDKSIRDFYEDASGKIWMAGWTEGLFLYDPKSGTYESFKDKGTTETGLNKIRCIHKIVDGKLIYGTYRGGLAEFNLKTKKYTYYGFSDSSTIDNKFITDIEEIHPGKILIASTIDLRLFDLSTKKIESVWDFTKEKKSTPNVIHKIFVSPEGEILLCTNLGLFQLHDKKVIPYQLNGKIIKTLQHKTIYDICSDKKGNWWMASRSGLLKYNRAQNKFSDFTTKDGLPSDLLFGVKTDKSGNLWISTSRGLSRYSTNHKAFVNYDLHDGLNNLIFYPSAIMATQKGTIYLGGTEGVNFFDPEHIQDNPYIPPVYITGFTLFNQEKKFSNAKEIELNYDQHTFSFSFVALNYALPEKNQYAFMMEGIDKNWHYCGQQRTADYNGLPPGNYVFKVKASNNDGIWNTTGASVVVIIHPPFWETWWFKTLCITLVVIGIVIFYRARTRAIKKRNLILEKTVKERTAEVVHQKEQLQEQKKEILDSIHYAKRIQTAILTSEEYWNGISPNNFVFFKPKDIVSGDFYWAYHTHDGKAIWTVADCTGHGVPGAFMSMIGNSFLNEIVVENNQVKAAEILNMLRQKIVKSMEQKGNTEQQKDGMDLALCVWDKKNNVLEYAGANNPIYIIRQGELQEFKPNKMPIGYYINMQSFESSAIEVKKGDRVYSFSDGFADQFGGPNGKKYKYSQLKDFLLSVQSYPMQKQKELLHREFENWKGQFEQLDDICVVGIEIL